MRGPKGLDLAVALGDEMLRGVQIDAGGFQRLMPDLFLDNGQGQFVFMNVVHDMAVPERMD